MPSDPPPPPARRGRPVSLASRTAAVDAARELLRERGYSGFTVDEVSRRSGVSKATLYRHWPDGFALAVESLGDIVTDAVPVRAGGDPLRNLRRQVVRLAAFYASAEGRLAAELIGAAAGRPDGDALVRDRFFGRRRAETAGLVDAAKSTGHIRRDLDTDLVVDLVFGAVVFRIFNGLGPLNVREARAIARVAVAAVAADR